MEKYISKYKIRFVTASSLFDGHDVTINMIRRLLQENGVEVIHLGHNRSVEEIVNAAIQEDVQGISVSSYQGGHIEYFKYMYDLLQERGASHIKIFGGGGGVILPREQDELEAYGITKIYSPEDGRIMGLQGMINHILQNTDFLPPAKDLPTFTTLTPKNHKEIARAITYSENKHLIEENQELVATIEDEKTNTSIVVGITGTGGSGKSSLTDELIRRFIQEFPDKTLGIVSIDPTKRKTGGALLGDRIRMNAIHHPNVYMRSLATRESQSEISNALEDTLKIFKAAGFDVIFVETSGIGQGDAAITNHSDINMYVMTSEFGAPSQLEKIDMIDYADLIAINKFERQGSEDALRLVQKQYQRSRHLFHDALETFPVYGTIASQFNDVGTNNLFLALIEAIEKKVHQKWETMYILPGNVEKQHIIIPSERRFYLREIADSVRNYHKKAKDEAKKASRVYQLKGALQAIKEAKMEDVEGTVEELHQQTLNSLAPSTSQALQYFEQISKDYSQDQLVQTIRGKEIKHKLTTETLSGIKIPKVALPSYSDYGDIVQWVAKENIPGYYPFTAGVFPFKRQDEDPKRQFAGEGPPDRTNRRFHYLSKDDTAKRLSTAFDSVTLYGEDPAIRPDIFGKIGESGVSVCTLDNMIELYKGFNLCDPSTSVSMTINGPAPIILAMFLNTAIHQQVEMKEKELNRILTVEEFIEIKNMTLKTVRGTVQADILKEDQGQNTCIFSTEFALKMMGDIQQYFIENSVRNYYSVSISGYHIAEAGANPISQLAFTLSNGFTYVEYYLSRGMHIDDFAPNLSFFFSNGLDAEYAVIGRVARRIWAVAMKEKYGASERSQKLKYHVQTSGRSLHAKEMAFNDIRTTLQALLALYDNCNSLHTNAYDEAVTTPTEESVRRAMAIQLIINKENGLSKNENPQQGAYIIEQLTDLVEEAVLKEFERISDRGGVLGAMELQYQRGKIQEESLYYETLKHNGDLPIIGVNVYQNPNENQEDLNTIEIARASYEEKQSQIDHVEQFKVKHVRNAKEAIEQLKKVARMNGNIFAELMEAVKVASLGQITQALYEVGGQYRRNM
ncbi:methylmalonyl-CoA mutase family protein [Bacillus sp. RG28]|uniref:Fused isobutyryl-CoA mutase n=1 Tax=Gottfriedia endophytica TaxID=2820819 RepID=A0A940SGG2_9BACI|nr:fused isobutyryl-CoA mutase/GTPase IcmF [Gottfriedia endophytica]MBP0725027.1 methylmalonyl-CoA mutase family protein [Gottfriedia endophytica]